MSGATPTVTIHCQNSTQDANNPGRPMPLMVAADEDKGRTRVVFIRNVFAFVPVADRAAELNHYVRLDSK